MSIEIESLKQVRVRQVDADADLSHAITQNTTQRGHDLFMGYSERFGQACSCFLSAARTWYSFPQ
jgi:hypothetical protein